MGSNCETYKPKNPLPFRRLKEYANGIWDETRKEFYPFRQTSITVLAKTGIRYFVSGICLAGDNEGEHAASAIVVSITVFGKTSYYELFLPVTTAGSSACGHIFYKPNVLCDVNTALIITSTATMNKSVCIYAEIPDDPAGGPVVVS